MTPEKNVFIGLDLLQLAQKEHGPGATVFLPPGKTHLYDWKAMVNGKEKGLNFASTYRSIHGNQFLCFSTGVHAYDWKIIDLNKFKTNNYVVPLLILPSDSYTDIEGVRKLVANIEKLMSNLQNFYFDKSSRWMKWVPPIIQISGLDSAAFEAAGKKGGNFLLELTEAEIKKSWDTTQLYNLTIEPLVNNENKRNITVIAFTTARVKDSAGNFKDPTGDGGRARGNFCVLPPLTINYAFNDYMAIAKGSKEDAVFYVLAHEGGHAMGLPHTCHFSKTKTLCLLHPRNAKSIMHEKKQNWFARDGAGLGPSDVDEVKKLKALRYISL